MAQRPVIINVAFDEVFPRMAQCGYRYVSRAKDDIASLRSTMPAPVTTHIAQVAGHPPLFMVKGPLFPSGELRGQPQVEYVVTLTQAFPNSYPIITIEGPPQGWSLKRHPNVDVNGCCFLQSVSQWDPRTSRIAPCIKELQAAFRMNHPFQQNVVAQAVAPQPAAAPVTQAVAPQPPAAPARVAPQPTPLPQPLGAPTIAMPAQTLTMGTVIYGATNATNGRTDVEIVRQRENDQRWLAEYQQRQQTSSDPSVRNYVISVSNFSEMISGHSSRPNSTVDCPLGFGFARIATGADASFPLRVIGTVPPVLPPCEDPTPDEVYRQTEEKKAIERVQREAQAQSQSRSNGAFGGLGRALNIGAAMVTNLAGQAASSVESEVRKSEQQAEMRRFASFLPQFATERLAAEYPCSTLLGNGLGVAGLFYITDLGIHFTTKRSDGLPPTITYGFDMSYNQIACLVKGSSLGYEWLHFVYDDGQFRSIYNVSTTTAATIGEYVSSSIKGSPYSRLYSWVDHKWRAVRFGGRNVAPPPNFVAPPLPPPPPAAPLVAQTAAPTSPPASDSDQCVICMDRCKNQFFQPCGHVCCCQQCAKSIKDCPICRSPIQQVFQAFL